MIKRVVLLTVATLACVVASAPAAEAGSSPFCVDVLIDSGHTCIHGNNHVVVALSGYSTGNAVASVYLWSAPTVSGGGYVTLPTYASCGGCTAIQYPNANGYPALHNHSGYLSRFHGNFAF